jgi:hypothetical protein
MSEDLQDLLVGQARELAEVRYEMYAYKGWFKAAIDLLHDKEIKIERQRRQLAALIDENRRLRGQDVTGDNVTEAA